MSETPWIAYNGEAPVPAPEPASVSRWREATVQVVSGLALCTFTLNALGLAYILPTVGAVLMFLGFQTLRRENLWFRRGCIAAALRLGVLCANLVCYTSVRLQAWLPRGSDTVVATALLSLSIAICYCLWQGLMETRAAAGLRARADSAGCMIVWYLVCFGLGVAGYHGGVLAWLLVGALVVILCCLYHCMGEVDGTDYPFDPPPPRWSGGALILTVATVLVLGGALGYSVGAGCPMHWAPRDPAEQAGVTETRAYLENLGFPAEVLDDLTPEDIAACAGAIQVVVQEDDQPVSSYRLRTGGDASPVEPEELLHFVSVAVEVRERQWKLFHHVRWNWNGEQDFYGTEAMVVRPVYGTGVGSWLPGSAVPTGRVLCERKGRTYAAPCYSVGDQIGQTSSVFFGLSPWEAVCGTFSLPRHSQNSRGYVSYSALGTPEGGGMNSHVSYVHQINWFRYPAVTAAEYRTAGAVGNTFWTVQTLMSYYPPDKSADCPTF